MTICVGAEYELRKEADRLSHERGVGIQAELLAADSDGEHHPARYDLKLWRFFVISENDEDGEGDCELNRTVARSRTSRMQPRGGQDRQKHLALPAAPPHLALPDPAPKGKGNRVSNGRGNCRGKGGGSGFLNFEHMMKSGSENRRYVHAKKRFC